MAVKEEVKQYLVTLAQTYGLDEKALLKKAEEDEKAAQFVADTTMTRSDYSRKMDEVTRLQKEAADLKAKAEGYYANEWLPKWQQREQEITKTQQELTQHRAEIAAYRELYGTLQGFQPSAAAGGQGPGNSPAAPGVSPQTGTVANPQYMTQQDAAALAGTLAKEMTFVGMRFMREFPNKDFDPDQFEQFVMKGGYQGPKALRQAYDDFVKPDRDARVQAEHQKALEGAKKAGYEEALAKVGPLPVDTSSPNFKGSPVFHKPSAEDQAAAALADPNTPQWQKEEIQRSAFMGDLSGKSGSFNPSNLFRQGG